MRAAQSLVGLAFVATAFSVSAASTDDVFAVLLKRQEPGTPGYNCHDNCGQAIIEGRNSDDICNDDIFLTDYKNCLQCAGADNQDIWAYYGNTLTADAESCGLSTTPLSGTQPDVGAAVPAGSGSASSATSSSAGATTTTSSSPAAETATSSPATSSAAEISSSAGTGRTAASASEETRSTGTAETGSATMTGAEKATTTTAGSSVVTAPDSTTVLGTGTGVVAPTTTSDFAQITAAANTNSGKAFGVAGAMAFAAMFFGL